MLVEGKRLSVFSIRSIKGGTVWCKAGHAFVNKDGSLNVYLDMLPIDGKLHVREAGEKRDAAPSHGFTAEAAVAESMGGH